MASAASGATNSFVNMQTQYAFPCGLLITSADFSLLTLSWSLWSLSSDSPTVFMRQNVRPVCVMLGVKDAQSLFMFRVLSAESMCDIEVQTVRETEHVILQVLYPWTKQTICWRLITHYYIDWRVAENHLGGTEIHYTAHQCPSKHTVWAQQPEMCKLKMHD